MADEHCWRVNKKILVKTKKEALKLVAEKLSKAAMKGEAVKFELLEIGPISDACYDVKLSFDIHKGKILANYELKPQPKWK